MNITSITKGHVITAANGTEYTVLSKAPQLTGTGGALPVYVTMVRPVKGGRGFDLHLTQESLDCGAYTVTKAAK